MPPARPKPPPLTVPPPGRWGRWVTAARPKTLAAAAAPVIMGTAMALEAGVLHLPSALAALVSALLIQIGTNFNNDYADFARGADTEARKGPLRATQAGLTTPAEMQRATAIVLGVGFLVGLYLVYRGGWPVLALGLTAIASGIAYTSGRYALAYTGLADAFVLVFFGPVAVAGAYYVQALRVEPLAAIAGLGAGLLAVAILLANNIRDVDEDRAAGKRTLVVRLGRQVGCALYLGCIFGAAGVAAYLGLMPGGHRAVLLCLVIVVPGALAYRTLRECTSAARLNPVLGLTARLLLAYALIFTIGWLN